MAQLRSRFYLHLAIVLNCLILAFLILDSRSISSLDINIGLLPNSWESEHQDGDQGSLGWLSGIKGGCGMCRANRTLCDEFGSKKLEQAVWYAGTGQRMKRFLSQASRGEGFTVGVVGGSVSKGHGLGFHDGYDEPETFSNMNRMIFDHLDALFPAEGGAVIGEAGGNGKNGFVNGAQGGMGTSYFAYCFGEHIPDNTDLILIDMSINDELYLMNMPSYELLLRGLLDMPNKPAIINMQIFALMFGQLALGGDLHAGLNQFYDIPTVSLRGPLLHDLLADVSVVQDYFNIDSKATRKPGDLTDYDLRHISPLGHRRMAEFVNAYLDWQLCELTSTGLGPAFDEDQLDPLPRQMLMQKYDQDLVLPPLKPMCMSTNGQNHPLIPIENHGWENWAWKQKNYIRASKPGSKIAFDFTTSFGDVQLHYLRSATFGLGNVKCWVDDEVDKAIVIEAYWDLNVNLGKGTSVRKDLKPGRYTLWCEVLEQTADPGGGTEFRIISVMSI